MPVITRQQKKELLTQTIESVINDKPSYHTIKSDRYYIDNIDTIINSLINTVDNNIKQITIRKKIFECKSGWNIIALFEDQKIFEEYAIDGAWCDEDFYRIPYDVWYAITTINREEIRVLSCNLESYKGNIQMYCDDIVTITCGE